MLLLLFLEQCSCHRKLSTAILFIFLHAATATTDPHDGQGEAPSGVWVCDVTEFTFGFNAGSLKSFSTARYLISSEVAKLCENVYVFIIPPSCFTLKKGKNPYQQKILPVRLAPRCLQPT